MRASTVLRAVAVVAAALTIAACSGEAEVAPQSGGAPLVGVALPTSERDRWAQGGAALEAELEERGYAVDLQYAAADAPTQASQIQNMLTKGAEALVVAAVDGPSLRPVLRAAAETGVPLVAYDRPLDERVEPDRTVAVDEVEIGRQQARSVLNGLGLTGLTGIALANAPEGPFAIELFAGPPADETAVSRWDGAQEVLQPFLDDGTLVVPSGRTGIERAALLGADARSAGSRFAAILEAHDTDGTRVDAVLSPSDEISQGLISALRDAGYLPGRWWPVISGYGAELEAVRAIEAGEQYATVFADPRALAAAAAAAVDALMQGAGVDDPSGATALDDVRPVIVRADLVERVLLESGYWSADDLED